MSPTLSRIVPLLALAVACEPAADGARTLAGARLAPPALALTHTTLVGGAPATFTVTGAPAGGTVVLFQAADVTPGGWCPASIAPACLDLTTPVNQVARLTADASGVATWTLNLPAGLSIDRIGLQAGARSPSGVQLSAALGPAVHPASSDFDGDGLSARDEVRLHGTDPGLADSDGGGDDDGVEILFGTDPTSAADDVGTYASAAGLTAPASVLTVANYDDDNGDGDRDWSDARFGTDDELVDFQIAPSVNGVAAGITGLRLRLEGETGQIKVLRSGQVVLHGTTTSLDLPWQAGAYTLELEGRSVLRGATLIAREIYVNGALGPATEIELLTAPLLLNHHLQPAEHVYAMAVGGFGGNQAFISGYVNALGSDFTTLPSGPYGGDVWVQDEVEFATMRAPSVGRVDVVMDSIRDRGLDDFAEDYFGGVDEAVETWGRGSATSQDSFGNVEVSPPVTVDGVEYPYGRVYYGARGENFGPHPDLEQVLADQLVQAPFAVDSSWLCVGHVDEWISFVPDASSPKGFKLIYADITAAYDLLESLPQSRSIPKYSGFWTGHGYGTIGSMVSDRGLRAYNEDLETFYLLPILDQLRSELGLGPNDIVSIPSLFEPISSCSNDAAAMIPGMVNLIVANQVGQRPKIFMADPFLRSNTGSQSGDALISDVRARMPGGMDLYFLDDWLTYHLALGEVHCGTNVLRTPAAAGWWDTANDLLGRTP